MINHSTNRTLLDRITHVKRITPVNLGLEKNSILKFQNHHKNQNAWLLI